MGFEIPVMRVMALMPHPSTRAATTRVRSATPNLFILSIMLDIGGLVKCYVSHLFRARGRIHLVYGVYYNKTVMSKTFAINFLQVIVLGALRGIHGRPRPGSGHSDGCRAKQAAAKYIHSTAAAAGGRRVICVKETAGWALRQRCTQPR